jgi:hypothetical protein
VKNNSGKKKKKQPNPRHVLCSTASQKKGKIPNDQKENQQPESRSSQWIKGPVD